MLCSKSWAFCFGQVMYASVTAYGGSSIYDPFSIAACNALLFIPITALAWNRALPEATLLRFPHLYRRNSNWLLLNLSTAAAWFLRALYQSTVTYMLIHTLFSPAVFAEGNATCYSEAAVASFTIFLVIQCANICLETTTFSMVQAGALAFGLLFSLAIYLLFNDMIKAQARNVIVSHSQVYVHVSATV